MAEMHGENPTVIGADVVIKGELTFDKAVRIDGTFEGQIRSKGTLTISEGAKVTASVEAGNVRLEGECKGNLYASEKLQLMATAKMEGDIKATRLEIADGAIFIGNVTVGSGAPSGGEARRPSMESSGQREGNRPQMGGQPMRPRPQPQAQEAAAAPAASA